MRRLGALMAVLAAACGSSSPTSPPLGQRSPPPEPRSFVIAAAGDIACGPQGRSACRQMETASVIEAMQPDLVLAIGDTQYENGELANFIAMYGPSWGRFKAITRPAVGNHEYQTPRATGYFDYFNGPARATGVAGDRSRGYYSFDLGGWHLIALNSNCGEVGGCQAGSPQETWLRVDLLASDSQCTLAFFHHPLFSSGQNGNNPQLRPLWQALYDNNADVVLTGHDHVYERFAPQTPQGVVDMRRGIRQIVVGTGGHSLTRFVSLQPNSEVRSNQAFGVLRMELLPEGYTWEFLAAPGTAEPFGDAGGNACH